MHWGNPAEIQLGQTHMSKLSRAAEYLRMSRGHQQYSITNQSAAIALYAAAHNIGIIRSFVDSGRSGTTIKKRSGLQALLNIVQAGQADFNEILVYDVSRWGRLPSRRTTSWRCSENGRSLARTTSFCCRWLIQPLAMRFTNEQTRRSCWPPRSRPSRSPGLA